MMFLVQSFSKNLPLADLLALHIGENVTIYRVLNSVNGWCSWNKKEILKDFMTFN